jgi:hypothetical protein
MEYELMDPGCADEGEPSTAPEHIPPEQPTPVSVMSTPIYSEMSDQALAAQYLRELEHSRQGEPCTETYAVELFRRATVQGNQEARMWVHYCFGEVVRGWLHRHPSKEAACRLESEEYYVVQTFERFWQATVSPHRLEFSRLAAALQYLRACLHGAILDRLRASAPAREGGLPEPGEPQIENGADSSEAWGVLKTILPDLQEQRLAYLLFHCGLKPREIIHFYPQEFSDAGEIYRLSRDIMERILRNADQLR